MLKRYIKRPSFLLVLILMPLCTLGLKGLDLDQGLKIKAGIISLGEFDASLFTEKENEAVEFIPYTDADIMKEDVKGRKIECGYIFTEGFPSVYDEKAVNGSVVCLKSPATSFEKIVNEVIFSRLFGSYALDILKNEASKHRSISPDELVGQYTRYIKNNSAVALDYEYINTVSEAEEPLNILYFSKGILGILILLCACMGGFLRQADRKNRIGRAFSPLARIFADYSYFIVPSLMACLFAYISLLITGVFGKGEGLPLFVYGLCAAAVGLLLSSVFRTERYLFQAITVMLICCLVFCPVAIDISGIMPGAKIIEAILIPTHYINNSLIKPLIVTHLLAFGADVMVR